MCWGCNASSWRIPTLQGLRSRLQDSICRCLGSSLDLTSHHRERVKGCARGSWKALGYLEGGGLSD